VARLSKQHRQQLAQGTPAPSATGSSRATAVAPRPPQRGQKIAAPWWHSPWAWGSGVTGVVVIVIVVFLILGSSSPGSSGPYPLMPASVVNEVTHVSPSVSSAVGAAGLSNPFHAVPASTPQVTSSDGKPVVYYLGTDFCPYCAFERWSLVVALSRFGSFSGLHQTTSGNSEQISSLDGINSFSFYGSTYDSLYLSFLGVESADRAGNPLQTPTSAEADTAAQLTGGSVPLVDVGNRYYAPGAPSLAGTQEGQQYQYAPEIIHGMTWQQIADSLGNAQSAQAQTIIGNANWLTAAICKITGNAPSSVCTSSYIAPLITQLP
jgi:hypothetical protein